MITKSMPRKDGSYQSFQQLYDYITRDNGCDHAYNFTQNFILDDRDSVLNEFHRNSQLLRQRKNGNYLYHEIISFTRSQQLTESQQKTIIREACIRFAGERANNCLVFGGLHTDKDNQLHMHLMISANQLNQTKRHSISTKYYDTCKRNAENYILERHPEMEQDKLMSKPRTYRDDKEKLQHTIEQELNSAKSIQEFYSNLEKAGFSYKVRGRTHSFIIEKTGKAHRIKKLGFEAEYFNFLINHGGKVQAEPKPRKNKAKPDYSAGKGRVDRVAKTASEWVAGDFSKRDKEAQKDNYKKQNEFDNSVKSRKEQSTFENVAETASEWVAGDFSNREARERKQQSEERLKEYKKKQNQQPHVKNKEDMSGKEQLKESVDEWVFGDFSARDSRASRQKRYNYQTNPDRIESVKQTLEQALHNSTEFSNQNAFFEHLKLHGLIAYGTGDDDGLQVITGVRDNNGRAYSLEMLELSQLYKQQRERWNAEPKKSDIKSEKDDKRRELLRKSRETIRKTNKERGKTR